MIQTAGYDIFAQIHEKALNEALAMAFYSGMVCIKGDYSIAEKIPSQFAPFSQFKYELKLTKEPYLDFRSQERVFILFGGQLKVTLFDCVDVYFGVNFNALANIKFEILQQKLQYEIKKASILKLEVQNEYHVGNDFLNKFNYIIEEIINAYFKNEFRTIDIKYNINDLGLPLPILQSDVRIFDNKSVVVGLSFFH